MSDRTDRPERTLPGDTSDFPFTAIGSRLAWLALGLLGAVVLLWVWLVNIGPIPGDRLAIKYFGDWRLHGPVFDLAHFFYYMATLFVAAVTVAVATWVVARNVGRNEALLVPVAASVVIANAALKAVLGPTPIAVEFFPGEGASYPSGHVAYATALFGWLALVALREGRREIATILLGVVVTMGPARVVAGSHFPSDVIAGYAVGVAWLIGLLFVWQGLDASRRT